MQLHYRNTPANYFQNKEKTLAREQVDENFVHSSPSFMDLKIIEFWRRFLRVCPDGDCELFCNKYMTEERTAEFADRVYAIRDNVDFKDYVYLGTDRKKYTEKELLDAFHKGREIIFAQKFLKCSSNFGLVDSRVRHLLLQVMDECATDWIAKGCGVDDVSLRRTFELKRIFHLSDEAIELILYLWLRDHQDMAFNVKATTGLPNFFNSLGSGSFRRTSLITGLEPSVLHELCSKESPLVKFSLVQMEDVCRNAVLRVKPRELTLASEIGDYLYGFSDISRIMDFCPAAKPSVSYAQIAKTNRQVPFVLQMLKTHQKGTPLNILFYGREGTGKTEMAKALAQELGVSLISVGTGDEMQNEESLLQTRLRSLRLADWECERSGGVILMDEADLVLNKAEKGLLNVFFESLKSPVIWITNRIGDIENSTRSRFDYSLEFFSFGKDERMAIWHTVLKNQKLENILCNDDIEQISEEIPVLARSSVLSVQLAGRMQSAQMPPSRIIREVASSHAKLLGVPMVQSGLGNEKYNADYVNISNGDIQSPDFVVPMLKNFDLQWKKRQMCGKKVNLNIFLYGPPGTGKTSFARHIARDILCHEIMVVRPSDILAMFVGESERRIRGVFREAEQREAVLFIDEADSFFENRDSTSNQWEVTLVNEFICQMDSFNGMLIAATNYEKVLDWAVRRRFQLKLAFGYMNSQQISKAWTFFFGNHCPEEICRCDNVAISDFQNVCRKLEYVPAELRTKELILQNMLEELANKDEHQGRKLGL